MPVVTVKMLARESTTDAQREAVIEGIIRVMVDVMHKKPESTTVIIEEIAPQNWGASGHSIAVRDATAG
jgi:4-oxalocrotonate tautomerase